MEYDVAAPFTETCVSASAFAISGLLKGLDLPRWTEVSYAICF